MLEEGSACPPSPQASHHRSFPQQSHHASCQCAPDGSGVCTNITQVEKAPEKANPEAWKT